MFTLCYAVKHNLFNVLFKRKPSVNMQKSSFLLMLTKS